MDEDEWNVTVGEVLTTFGHRGEVKVRPETDSPEHFQKLEQVRLVGGEADGRMLRIEKARLHKRAVIIKFAGIDDMSAAETLRGAEIRVRESQLMPLERDQYYIHDIIGLDVITTDGRRLGKIKEVIRSPANDVYVTDRAMIPAVKEFVVSIDLQEKRMVVRPVEGLVQE